MPQQHAPYTPGWLQRLENFGLVRAGLTLWLAGLAGLSLHLGFRLVAGFSLLAAALLTADSLWWKPRRDAAAKAEGGPPGP